MMPTSRLGIIKVQNDQSEVSNGETEILNDED